MKSETSSPDITPLRPSTPSAERMRRSRERRRRGMRSVRIQLDGTQLQALIAKGFLGPAPYDQDDLEFAINTLLGDTLTDEK